MTLSVAMVVMFTTLVLGTICKSINICSKSNIPLLNLIIGIISGVLCYFAGLEENILYSIIFCVISAFSAGGVYDLSEVIKKK